MSEPVQVPVDGVDYKVHDNGEVFRVNPGFWSDSTRKVGKIPSSTPQNQLAEKIRDLPGR